ncbi:MAG: hypothetical protein AAF333_00410 [Planctomycetota bacterium]
MSTMAHLRHSTHHAGVMDRLRHLVGHRSSPLAPADPARHINRAINSDLRWLDEVLTELKSRIAGEPDAPLAELSSAKRRELELRRKRREQRERLETARHRMREQIIELHQHLRTGIDEKNLDTLAAFVRHLAPVIDDGGTSSLVASAHSAILRRIYRETGELAWAELFEALGRAETTWPTDASCVSEHAKTRALEEAHRQFIDGRARCTAELISGLVQAWTVAYPREGGTVWRQVALRGVGAGLRAGLMVPCIDRLQRDRIWILAEFRELVELQTDIVQGELSRGVHSPVDGERVTASVRRLMEEVLPGLVWKLVRQAIDHPALPRK